MTTKGHDKSQWSHDNQHGPTRHVFGNSCFFFKMYTVFTYFVQFMNCSNTPMKMYFCVNFIYPHLITEVKCISKKDKYIYKNFPFLKICHTYTKPATKH